MRFHELSFSFTFNIFSYGYAQCQPLPVGDYEFIDPSNISLQEILDTPDDGSTGYIIEADLTYPSKLHKDHREFPLAPEKIKIFPSMLGEYQEKCQERLNLPPKTSEKLTATFQDREKYVLHYKNLKLYTSLGMKVKKIRKVLKFRQEAFLKTYIDFCTEMRQKAKSDFAKRLFKLMANSCYGKTIENVRKHLIVKFATSEKEFIELCSDPRFKARKIISKSLVAVFFDKAVVTINQPYAVGFTILEGSKHFMYDSFYNKFKPAFPKLRLLFTDTDSFFISIPFSKNPHKKIKRILDTSNFSKTNPLFSSNRKSKLGYFKSETGDDKITHFLGIRSKTYAFKTVRGEQKKCKGIAKRFAKKISFSAYEKCITDIASCSAEQISLRSFNHSIKMLKSTKLAFSSFDDKRFMLSCGFHSLPYGNPEYPVPLHFSTFAPLHNWRSGEAPIVLPVLPDKLFAHSYLQFWK